MAVLQFPKSHRVRPVQWPSVRHQLAGIRYDLAVASRECRDPLAVEELASAARRLGVIIQRMELGQ